MTESQARDLLERCEAFIRATPDSINYSLADEIALALRPWTMVYVSSAHGWESGMTIARADGSRWRRLWWLMRRPTVSVVGDVTDDAFSLSERPMTAREWAAAFRALLR